VALSAGLEAVDRTTLAYALASTAALALRWDEPLPARGALALAQGLLVAVPFLAARARVAGRVGRFLGEWYPVALVTALYTQVGLLNTAAGVAHDVEVQRWEATLFGSQPSVGWIRAWPWPALSWLLHAGYLSYYFIVVGTPLALWLSGRREGARRTILLMALAFYVSFALFLLYPVAGPRYEFPLADNPATRIPIARFTHGLLNRGAAWGTAFPSSHVAVALAAAGSALREWPRLGAVVLVAAVLLALGTVYGQFHYAVDALAGLALAGAVLAIARVTIAR
jgi:membrane-associated phospholipid phosphatase